MTLTLEWIENIGPPAPTWLDRFAAFEEPSIDEELLLFLAGARDLGRATARGADEFLVDVLAALPADGLFANIVDGAASRLLMRAETHVKDSRPLPLEGLDRLLRVLVEVPDRLPAAIEASRGRVRDDSYRLFPSFGYDLSGGLLHVVARAQTNVEFVPLWWRLCDLDSLVPEHADIGVLGLRWSPLGASDDFESIVAKAIAIVADGCARSAHDALISEERARRVLMSIVRSNRRARADLDWSVISEQVLEAVRSDAASRWVRKAFGVESRGAPRRTPARYEDPDRAKKISSALGDNPAKGLAEALAFLETQRTEAARRGDVLPLVQSLCNFAHGVMQNEAARAIEWASEASLWQPTNHYTAVTLAEAYLEASNPAAAGEVVLSRRTRLSEAPPFWAELGKVLGALGEGEAAREALFEAVERFPWHAPLSSSLGELLVRLGEPAHAVEAFEAGLRYEPHDEYLLPGQIRALALVGRKPDAMELLAHAESYLPGHPVLQRRRHELTSGDHFVRAMPAWSPLWRDDLSADALAGLSMLLRRSARRRAESGVETKPTPVSESVAHVLLAHKHASSRAASELAFSGIKADARLTSGSVRELVRVREARERGRDAAFTPERFDLMTIDNARAGVSDQRLAPLTELSRLRAAATLVDGDVLAERGIEAIRTLRALHTRSAGRNGESDGWDRPLSVGERRAEWAGAALSTLGAESAAPEPAAATLRSIVQAKSLQLDTLEEDAALSLGA